MRNLSLIAAAISSIILSGCQQTQPTANQNNAGKSPTAKIGTMDISQDEIKKADKIFNDIFMQNVMRSPVFQTYLGIKDDYDKWDDSSEKRNLENQALRKKNLNLLLTLNDASLDDKTRTSYKLMKQQLENQIADFKWRLYSYPVNQMYGTHSMVPAFLINQHQISDIADAKAYIARLNGVPTVFKQLEDNLQLRAENGIIPPKFVFPYVIESSKNIIQGAPFDNGKDSALLADFKRKITALKISKKEKDVLIAEASKSLQESIKPAYTKLISYFNKLATHADERDGVWKFPNGETFYNNALARTTTTELTAEEIHQTGLDEVERIHNEMREIKDKVKFKGDLKAFMHFMKTDKQFYLSNDEAGRKEYLNDATHTIEVMKSRLDELFLVKPKADLVVKRVEAFREKAAGKAFYQLPAPDGSRPGYYYANLYDMSAMPTYQMQALAYHEGIPGHHMQIAIAQELEDMPQFRKYASYTAYIEGWGLYSELLPSEMNLYSDPYADFGRLSMELWRACRLVVDTGIHAMKWTRQQGIDYYTKNTPNAKSDAIKMVERHIVMPSQATAYKIGMLKILELRAHAKKQLGDKFDIRQFHDVVLKNGAVPLNVLEQFVNQWIENLS